MDPSYLKAMFDDYLQRMSPSEADKRISRAANTIKGAIERGEIRYYKTGSRKEVTPVFIAEWLMKYALVEPTPLPG